MRKDRDVDHILSNGHKRFRLLN